MKIRLFTKVVLLLFCLIAISRLIKASGDITRIADWKPVRIKSPDGRYYAEYFHRMDSLLGDSSQSMNLYVWPTSQWRTLSWSRVFIGHCWHPKESSVDTGDTPFEAKWVNSKTLEVSCPRFFAVYEKKQKLFDFEIDYKGDFDQVWEPFWKQKTTLDGDR